MMLQNESNDFTSLLNADIRKKRSMFDWKDIMLSFMLSRKVIIRITRIRLSCPVYRLLFTRHKLLFKS